MYFSWFWGQNQETQISTLMGITFWLYNDTKCKKKWGKYKEKWEKQSDLK